MQSSSVQENDNNLIDPTSMSSIVEILRLRAKQQPDRISMRFLPDGTGEGIALNYQQMDATARSIAAHLQSKGLTGERTLMFYPSSLEFIGAFFGCMYAGVTAVPAYPPRMNRNFSRLQAILDDADPRAVLTTRAIYNKLHRLLEKFPQLANLQWVITDEIDITEAESWQEKEISADQLAFLQYTSGSTGNPKGVMITHGNLMANQCMMRESYLIAEDKIGVGWLPLFHDMGLIGMVMNPVFQGYQLVFTTPATFLQRPVSWLNAISQHRGTHCVVPNFAFEFCTREVTDKQIEALDLSSWEFVLCGSEPVRQQTLDDFIARFSGAGFRAENIVPCYGMAESTLLATCSASNTKPVYLGVDSEQLRTHKIHPVAIGSDKCQVLVGNGGTPSNAELKIVDPVSLAQCEENQVGEIWLAGPHISKGYWGNEEATRDTFHARITDGSETQYLRTGDMGVMIDEQLFITGRSKDVIIVHGRNYYPQDIEWTLEEQADERSTEEQLIMPGSSAAFSIELDGSERLILVSEVTRQFYRQLSRDKDGLGDKQAQELWRSLRRSVAEVHELSVHDLVLIRPGSLPKTSSGKVQRHRCRETYLDQSFPAVWSVIDPASAVESSDTATEEKSVALLQWLRETLGRRLDIEPDALNLDRPLTEYGMDSVTGMRLIGELEDYLDRSLSQDLLWEHESINALHLHLQQTSNNVGSKDTEAELVPAPDALYEPFPLNDIQRAYWIGRDSHIEMGGVGCHFYCEFDNQGMDLDRLSVAWQSLIQRHAMLRTVVNEEGMQMTLRDTPDYVIELADVSSHELREKMSHKTYDASVWPLFNITASQLDEESMRLHVSIDLLVTDVWSFMILLREWQSLYEHPQRVLPAIKLNFRDYLLADQNDSATTGMQEALNYWQDRIPDLAPAPMLPLACSPASIGVPRFQRHQASLDSATWEALKHQAAEYKLTPSVLLATVFSEVLGRWSRGDRFTLNLTLFNRRNLHADVDKLVGDFTSLLLLEVDQQKPGSIRYRAAELQKQLRQDLKHRQVSGVRVMRELGAKSKGFPVVFTSAVGMADHDATGNGIDTSWLGEQVYSISQTPQVWLDHQVTEVQGRLQYSWDVVQGLFPDGMIEDMFAAYQQMLQRLASHKDLWNQPNLDLLPEWQHHLIAEANATTINSPREVLQAGFLRQVAARPTHSAIIDVRRELNYSQLQMLSAQLAHALIEGGAKRGQTVAIVMDKGWEQIVACLAIVQTGAAYVPVDPKMPADRLKYIIETTGASLIMTQSWLREQLTWPENCLLVEVDGDPCSDYPTTPPEIEQAPEDMAYIIFTSGSTGVPKGVMIDHYGAVNTIADINTRFGVGFNDRIFAVSPLYFDLSVYDIFGGLASGASLVMPKPSKAPDPASWLELLDQHQITVWNSAPALMQILQEYMQGEGCGIGSRMRLVMMSGDRIPPSLPEKLKESCPNVHVVSLGGATEASIWSIYYRVNAGLPAGESIPYGKPLANQRFYVLDQHLAAVPVWSVGYLYIAGDGLALGYWKDDEKTAQAFINHPVTGERLYRTGDLGRYMLDGNIEFLGREDSQVKIQGVRIELGEIETALDSLKSISDSIVIATDPVAGERQLIAYVVAGKNMDVDNIKTQLLNKLPPYMVPPHIVNIDEIPLTRNGKVDRKRLPEVSHKDRVMVLPTTDMELQISTIWQEILGADAIGVDDNFFEIGGYSQLAVRLIIKLRETLQLELPVRTLFESPTIRELANRIERDYDLGNVNQEDFEAEDDADLYRHFARTAIGERIAIIKADKHYHSAEGQYLTYKENGEQHRVLDMVCGYGSAILGHNHPLLVDTVINNLHDGMPVHAQHSNNYEAGKLGREISRKLREATGRSFVATLASTGAEAVEAAIKHAKMAYKAENDAMRHYSNNMDALLLNEVDKGRLKYNEDLFIDMSRLLGVVPISDFKEMLAKLRRYNDLVLKREPVFIALDHAFHGMTSGALGLTASEDFRAPFEWMGVKAVRIAHEEHALRAILSREKAKLVTLDIDSSGSIVLGQRDHYAVAGLFLEPIQGEGGVFPLQREFTDAVRAIADEIGFPLIIDEIQCGMGRAGKFTAAETIGLRGDYYCFSKSLGGGLAKVSAMMVDRAKYQSEFGYLHGSTFAEDKPGCAVALRTLEIMDQLDVPAQALSKGTLFRQKLYSLFEEYPDIIKDVRGSGLMLGIELHSLADSPSFLFRTLTYHGQEMLNLIIAGYLLNEKAIRIAPTKSRNAIRFLPSVMVTEAEMDRVIDALSEVFDIIRKTDAGRLMRYMVADDTGGVVTDWRSEHPSYQAIKPMPNEPRVAHIGHLEDDATLLLAEPSLASLTLQQREALLEKLLPFSEVAVGQTLRVNTDSGDTVHLSIIGLPLTGGLFEKMMRDERYRGLLIEKIDDAVDLAMANGCKVIGFGGYTSIITMNCTAVARPGVSLTSGNAYTVGLGVEGARRGAAAKGLDLASCHAAVLGAKGNIGSISSRLLASEVSRLVLIGRDANDSALLDVAYQIYEDAWQTMNQSVAVSLTGITATLASLSWLDQVMSERDENDAIGKYLYQQISKRMGDDTLVRVSASLADLAGCDLVISATSSASPVIKPEHLSERVKVICDIATPKDVSEDVKTAWPDCLILSGGLARLPIQNTDQLLGTHLLRGHVFGCVAETTLLGLSQYQGHYSFGDMSRSQVESISALSEQYGYSLGYSKANAKVLSGQVLG